MGNLPHNVGARNSKCGGKKLKDFGKCFYSYKCCVACVVDLKRNCINTIYVCQLSIISLKSQVVVSQLVGVGSFLLPV
jgi:hypothetical protein